MTPSCLDRTNTSASSVGGTMKANKTLQKKGYKLLHVSYKNGLGVTGDGRRG